MKRLITVLTAAAIVAGCASAAKRETERARHRKTVDTQVQLGAAYMQSNKLEVAKNALDKALAMDADHSQAHNMMGLLQWRLKEYREAERHFRESIDNDQKNSAAYHNFGAFLCDRGRTDEALRVLEKAGQDPLYVGAAGANVNAGMCLMAKPLPTVAEKYFREALRINPNEAQALYYLARISYDSGKTLSARGFVTRYFQVAEDTPDSLLLASRIETALKDHNAAASYALRLRGKFPNSPQAKELAREAAAKRQ